MNRGAAFFAVLSLSSACSLVPARPFDIDPPTHTSAGLVAHDPPLFDVPVVVCGAGKMVTYFP